MKLHAHTPGHLTHQQPIELFGASCLRLSCRHLKFCFKCLRLHSACNKTCMLNLSVCTSQRSVGWHACFLEMIPRLHELALGFFHLLTVHRFEKKKKRYLKVWLRRKRPKSPAQTPTNQCKSVSHNIVHNYQTATHIKGLPSFTLITLIRMLNVGMRIRKPHCSWIFYRT